MADTTVSIAADTAQFLKEYEKLIASNKKLAEELKRLKQEAKSTGDSGKSAMGGFDEAIASTMTKLASAVAGVLSLSAAVEQFKQRYEALQKIGDRSNQAAKGMLSFQLLQEPGRVREAEAKLARIAAPYGVSPEAAGGTAQTIQSLRGGDLDKALPDIEAAFKLRRLGVDDQTLSQMATASIPKGISMERASDAFYKAAQLGGPLEPGDIGKVAPSMIAYRDPLTAVAAAGGLAEGGIPKEQLQDRTKDLGLALSLESDLTKKAMKKTGGAYEGMSEVEQLQYLKTLIPDLDKSGTLSQAEVMKAGINEQQKGQALAVAINQLPKIQEIRGAIAQPTPGLLESEYQKVMESPAQRSAMEADKLASATAWYRDYIGPEAESGRAVNAEAERVGAMATAEGRGYRTDEAGRASGWDVFREWVKPAFSSGGETAREINRRQRGEPGEPQTAGEATDRLIEALNKAADKIEANTKATEENSKSTDGGTSAPPRNGRGNE
jgi:hypothetical protein